MVLVDRQWYTCHKYSSKFRGLDWQQGR